LVLLLLQHGSTPLHWAAQRDKQFAPKHLATHSNEIMTDVGITKHQFTPQQLATLNDEVTEIVGQLLAAGAAVNAVNKVIAPPSMLPGFQPC
jgi:hypothetical protein